MAGLGLTNFGSLTAPIQPLADFDNILGNQSSPTQGAGLIGYDPSNLYPAGSVGAALGSVVYPATFSGADPLGVADSAPGINAALANHTTVYLPPGNYKIGSRLNSPPGRTLFADGQVRLFLAPGVNDHILVFANNSTHMQVYGIEFDGQKATNPGGGLGIACSGTGGGVTYVTIRECYIHDCGADGTRFFGTTVKYINCYGNTFENNGSAGLTSDDTIQFFTFHGNISRFNGTHGIGLIGTGMDGTISANSCSDNGQGTPNADNITFYNAANSRITVSANVSEGGLNNGIHGGGNDITYNGNMINGATQYGLIHRSSGTTPAVSNNVSMTGNVVSACVNTSVITAAICMSYCNASSISGNSSFGNQRDNLQIDTCANVAISGNTLRASNTASGVKFVGAGCANIAMGSNTIIDNTQDGVRVDTGTTLSTSTISANVIRTNSAYAVNVLGTDLKNIYGMNNMPNNTLGAFNGTFSGTTLQVNNITT